MTESRPLQGNSVRWTIYLAGPLNHCGSLQKTAWRDEFIRRLKRRSDEFRCFNPAEHQETWTPFAELYDIEQSQLVVANLWRESTGTIAGIIQARRAGKPVVIIDPNYVQSDVLKFYVAEAYTVNRVEDAVGVVLDKIRPRLAAPGTVVKTQSRTQPFDLAKLERSLTAACANAGVNDTLAALVTNELQERFQGRATGASGEALETARIKTEIFDLLQSRAEEQSGEYRLWFEDSIAKIRAAWTKKVETKKDPVAREADLTARLRREQEDNRELREKLVRAGSRIREQKAENSTLGVELAHARGAVKHLQRENERLRARAPRPPAPQEPLEKNYAAKFPNLTFSQHALKRLGDCQGPERQKYERIFALMNGGDLAAKDAINRTEPKVWEKYASDALRIYFIRLPSARALIALVGHKNHQLTDIEYLQDHPPVLAEGHALLAARATAAGI